MGRSILWFRQDLRLHDNEALTEAAKNADELIPVYIFNRNAFHQGAPRTKFLLQSVIDLRARLRKQGSDLIVRVGSPADILYHLALSTKSQWVYCNRERTHDEVLVQDDLERKLWTIGRELRYTRGKMLYYTADLPFPITHCPDSFFQFRKEVQHIIPVRIPLKAPDQLPSLPPGLEPGFIPALAELTNDQVFQADEIFYGGETSGLQVLEKKVWSSEDSPLSRNKQILSPWVSMGCLSPKLVYHHAHLMGQNDEAIRLNLIYRDYLRLMGKKYGDLIFFKSGITGEKYNYITDEVAFIAWTEGRTGVPILDAAMRQLNQTGWIPDVLRKITANYLINILGLDWTLGATYFESRLIDYDVCSNWVSWLNLAGVGPDAKEDRIIHYDLIGKKLDPEGYYIKRWIG